MSDSDDKPTNIIKASRLLQAKVGSGDIDDKRIGKSQTILDSDSTDFAPMAHEILDRLEEALKNVPASPTNIKAAIQPVTVEVMQIKGNAAMFSYDLVGNLANIVLNFLENLESWDADAHTIVDAHLKTLRVIMNNQMKGDGGEYGQRLTIELRDACQRYANKQTGRTV